MAVQSLIPVLGRVVSGAYSRSQRPGATPKEAILNKMLSKRVPRDLPFFLTPK
jgi:hypothetical protein